MTNFSMSIDGKFRVTGTISVVIPSLNGDYAKLLCLDDEAYIKLKEASDSNKGKRGKIYALYQDATAFHDLLGTGHGFLTKEQFDELLKKEYNLKLQRGRGGNWLKDSM